MSKILLSSLLGVELKDKFITVTDQFGTHYFGNIKEMKDWYAIAQASRVDKGGYFEIDDFDRTVITPDMTAIQTIIYNGYSFIFKNEANAKKWILERKGEM